MSNYNHSKNQDYIQYSNKKELAFMDQNVWDVRQQEILEGAGGRRLYSSNPRHSAYYSCFGGKDLETHYILGADRDDHPDHSSRFGYGRCPFGYCSGHFPGKYQESLACSTYDPQPQNMAPSRFYTEKWQDSAYSTPSQAQVDYNNWVGMNLPMWWPQLKINNGI